MKLPRKRESVSDLSSDKRHLIAEPSGCSRVTRWHTTGAGGSAGRVTIAGCIAGVLTSRARSATGRSEILRAGQKWQIQWLGEAPRHHRLPPGGRPVFGSDQWTGRDPAPRLDLLRGLT